MRPVAEPHRSLDRLYLREPTSRACLMQAPGSFYFPMRGGWRCGSWRRRETLKQL